MRLFHKYYCLLTIFLSCSTEKPTSPLKVQEIPSKDFFIEFTTWDTSKNIIDTIYYDTSLSGPWSAGATKYFDINDSIFIQINSFSNQVDCLSAVLLFIDYYGFRQDAEFGFINSGWGRSGWDYFKGYTKVWQLNDVHISNGIVRYCDPLDSAIIKITGANAYSDSIIFRKSNQIPEGTFIYRLKSSFDVPDSLRSVCIFSNLPKFDSTYIPIIMVDCKNGSIWSFVEKCAMLANEHVAFNEVIGLYVGYINKAK